MGWEREGLTSGRGCTTPRERDPRGDLSFPVCIMGTAILACPSQPCRVDGSPAPLAGPSLLRKPWQNKSVDDTGLWPWGFIKGRTIRTDSFARAAITKCHRLGALKNGRLFSHSSGSQKSKTTAPVGPVSGEDSVHGRLCVHKASSLASPPVLIRISVQQRAHPHDLIKALSPNTVLLGVRA